MSSRPTQASDFIQCLILPQYNPEYLEPFLPTLQKTPEDAQIHFDVAFSVPDLQSLFSLASLARTLAWNAIKGELKRVRGLVKEEAKIHLVTTIALISLNNARCENQEERKEACEVYLQGLSEGMHAFPELRFLSPNYRAELLELWQQQSSARVAES